MATIVAMTSKHCVRLMSIKKKKNEGSSERICNGTRDATKQHHVMISRLADDFIDGAQSTFLYLLWHYVCTTSIGG